MLNTIKSEKGIIKAMIISSLGFSIIHIIGIFTEISLIEVFTKIICSSLLGFSFVSLAIKLNNLWPLIIFHIVWNFIVMASSVIDIKVSNVTVLCNPLNIVISIILWTSIIMKISNKKPYHK